MAWKGDSSAIYTGGSGQMAVMGELLHRKCNAAIPHVDVGMDVFAFRDDREEVARIQVKTAPGERYKKGNGYHATFGVPKVQSGRTDDPPLFYALVVRLDNGWGSFIVISRAKLNELWNDGCGKEYEGSGNLVLNIQFRPDEDEVGGGDTESDQKLKAQCGEFDLTNYINAWESLPPLKPIPDIDVDPDEGEDQVEGIGSQLPQA